VSERKRYFAITRKYEFKKKNFDDKRNEYKYRARDQNYKHTKAPQKEKTNGFEKFSFSNFNARRPGYSKNKIWAVIFNRTISVFELSAHAQSHLTYCQDGNQMVYAAIFANTTHYSTAH